MVALKSHGLFRDFTNALGQQFFFWGRDVVYPHGNLLCEFGLNRQKSKGRESTSCYRMNFKGSIIELHGLCVGCYSTDGPGFLFTRHPRTCWLYDSAEPPPPGFYDKSLMRRKPFEQIEMASRKFLEWWLEYEDWIGTRTSKSYRDECYQDFKKVSKSKSWLPPRLALSWLHCYKDSPSALKRAREWKNREEFVS